MLEASLALGALVGMVLLMWGVDAFEASTARSVEAAYQRHRFPGCPETYAELCAEDPDPPTIFPGSEKTIDGKLIEQER